MLVADWKKLSPHPDDVLDTLILAAQAGDWESIQNARSAGIFDLEYGARERALCVVAALSILDHKPSAAIAVEAAQGSFHDWIRGEDKLDRNRILYEAVRNEFFLPRTCKTLLDADADPYSHGTGQNVGDDCLNALFVRGNLDQELTLLKILFGDEPITTSAQLPARFSFASGEHSNLLQICARVSRFDLVDWLHGRLVPGSGAKDILLDLGDKVLQHLWLDVNGAAALQVGMGPPGDGTEVSSALAYLAAGAELRDPDMWPKVARTIVGAEEEREKQVPLIDWIVSHSYPMMPSSDARIRRRVRTPRILHAFFKHDAISVDERLGDGRTLLMCAARQGEPSWVAYLLEKGADPLLTTDGKTASQLALEGAQPECAQMIDAFVARRAISRVLGQSRDRDQHDVNAPPMPTRGAP
jgi:hypothetical protein